MSWDWAKANAMDVAKFATDDALKLFKLDVNPFDLRRENKIEDLLKAIYDTLVLQAIQYDLEKTSSSETHQRIRTPVEVLNAPKQGTCLDLALLFCGLCLGCRLLPKLVIFEGHALVVVPIVNELLRENYKSNNYYQKDFLGGRKKDAQGNPRIEPDTYKNRDQLIFDLIDENIYRAIECTGFAYSNSMISGSTELPPEFNRNKEGYLTFEQAKEVGREQFNRLPFQYAVDIEIAHKEWGITPETFREEPEVEIDWHQVSQELLEKRLQLTTNPMTRVEDIDYQVDQVFVPLGLVERKKVPRQKGDVFPQDGSKLYREDREKEKFLKESKSPQDSEAEEITQKFEYEQFLEQVLKQGQSPKSQGKKVAIIGEPGSGKTTLLQQIARWVSTQFPASIVIWVSLADLDLDKRNLKQHVYEQWLTSIVEQYGQAEVSVQVKNALIAQCQQGHVWLLLDGLDEMPVAGKLLEEGGWLEGTRTVLTCRLNLWAGKPLAGFDVYRTLEFSYPQQVERFVARWFKSQDKANLGQALCAALKEPGKERIGDLVKNPLRLTLLCFDWGLRRGSLPETQAELYRRYVEQYYNWKAKEFSITPEERQTLNKALGQLSLAAIDDQDEQGNARFRLRHRFVQKFLNGTLFDRALELGWLNQVGVDADDSTQAVYAFYHTTFEEYFAALAIDDWDFFLPRGHKNKPLPDKKYRIFEPQWKQVLLLWMGRKGGELVQEPELKSQKEALIQALMTFKDGCKGFYSDRTFLLAAAGIAEFKDCTRADAIVDQLMQWLVCRPNWWAYLFDSARVTARRNLATSAIGSTDIQRAIQALVRVLESTQDEDTRWMAARSLGEIGTGNETAIQALVRVLESTQDEDTRRRAAWSLGQIGTGNETAIQALVRVLESTQYKFTRKGAAESLGQIGTGNETAIRALVRVLESTQDKFTRWMAAESLGQIGTGNETAIRALVRVLVLESTQDKFTRLMAAVSFGQIRTGNETVIQELVRVLESTQDEDIRRRAAESLGQIGTGNETASQALVRVLESTQDKFTRLMAAWSLGQIGTGNETVIQALVQVIESTQDEDTRSRAAESLGQIGTGNETASQALVRVLESTQDEYTRWMAAKSLGQIGTVNETAIQALVRVLESTQDKFTRRKAAESLVEIGMGNETAIRELVRVLESTQDKDTHKMAAESLGKIGTGNETAIQALVRVLESTQDQFTRWKVVVCQSNNDG